MLVECMCLILLAAGLLLALPFIVCGILGELITAGVKVWMRGMERLLGVRLRG